MANLPIVGRNWRNIGYLEHGSPTQQRAFRCLITHGIIEKLAGYDPVLVSTVCNDIAIETSDLDIVCEVYDHQEFASKMRTLFGEYRGFVVRSSARSPEATVVQFFTEEFEIEIFGQGVPIAQQRAYIHLVQAARVIDIGGNTVRDRIRALKQSGLKTEPAVAQILGLPGDPYQAVVDLQDLSDEAIAKLLHV
jgi:hypothetical protein